MEFTDCPSCEMGVLVEGDATDEIKCPFCETTFRRGSADELAKPPGNAGAPPGPIPTVAPETSGRPAETERGTDSEDEPGEAPNPTLSLEEGFDDVIKGFESAREEMTEKAEAAIETDASTEHEDPVCPEEVSPEIKTGPDAPEEQDSEEENSPVQEIDDQLPDTEETHESGQTPHQEQEQPSEPFSTDDAPEPQSAPLPRVGEERALSAVLGRIREKRQGQQSDSDNLPKTAKIPNSTDERDCDESETEIPAQVTAEQDEATQEHRDIDREADKGGSARKHVKATAALLLVIVAAGAFWIYGMFAPTFMVGQWQPDKSLYDRMLSEAAKGKPREERETLYKESAVFRNAKLSIDSENITTTWPNLGYRNSYRIVSSIESELNLDVDYLQNATSRWQVRKTPTGIEIQRGAKLPVPFKRMPPKSAKNPKIRNPLDGHWIGPVAGTVIDVTFEGNTMTNQAGEQLIKWEQNQDTVTVTEEDGDKRRFQIKDQGRIVFLNAFQARDVTLRRQ